MPCRSSRSPAGFLSHRYLTRHVHAIHSPAADNFSIIGMGGPHGQPFTLPAFEAMHYEADDILHQVIGSASTQHCIYVVPSAGGFDIYMHSYSDVVPLTEQQTLQLRKAVWDRMRVLSRPSRASTE